MPIDFPGTSLKVGIWYLTSKISVFVTKTRQEWCYIYDYFLGKLAISFFHPRLKSRFRIQIGTKTIKLNIITLVIYCMCALIIDLREGGLYGVKCRRFVDRQASFLWRSRWIRSFIAFWCIMHRFQHISLYSLICVFFGILRQLQI